MATTISGIQGVGLSLASGGQNPLTVTPGGGILVPTGDAIYGLASYPGIICNSGTLGTGASGQTDNGIVLKGGGTVTNAAVAPAGISGGYAGVNIRNDGAGGSVINASGGLIEGAYAGVVFVGSSAGNLINSGVIDDTGPSGAGVGLLAGGNVWNGPPGAVITGAIGIYGNGGVVGVTNLGTITSRGFPGVLLDGGGAVVNGTSGATSGFITGVYITGSLALLFNAATVAGAGGFGVLFGQGGTVTNGDSGNTAALISGQYAGVAISKSTNGLVINQATIVASGPTSSGIDIIGSGTVINGTTNPDARISGGLYGVQIDAGSVTNGASTAPGAVIAAPGIGIDLVSGYGTISNYGNVSGATGIRFGPGFAGSGTLVNAGTIIGNAGTAVYFGSDSDNTVRMTPGAEFVGEVIGYKGGSNNLWLDAGPGIGTIAGIGSGSFVNFQYVQIAAGANWALPGSNAFGPGTHVNNAGTIHGNLTLRGANGVNFTSGFIGGAVYDDGGTIFANAGTIAGSGGVAVSFASGNDIMGLAPGAMLGGAVIASSTGSNTLLLNPGAGIGILPGLGAPYFINFATIAVGPTAQWSLTGNNTFSPGLTLNSFGTFLVSGTLVNEGGVSGVITLSGGTLVNPAGIVLAGGVYGLGAPSYLTNRGTISARVPSVGFAGDGTLFNSGLIAGNGVSIGGSAIVTNLGSLTEGPSGSAAFVDIGQGTLVNGSPTDTTAYIEDQFAATQYNGQSTVTNYATIGRRLAGTGVVFNTGSSGGGTVVNGTPADTTAYISGVGGTARSVVNYATIAEFGVVLTVGGTLINHRLITSVGVGVDLVNRSDFTNEGVVSGGASGLDIYLGVARNAAGSTISGPIGIRMGSRPGDATVINAGTIVGVDGLAVYMRYGHNLLDLLPGAVVDGLVSAGPGGGTVELAAGAAAGTIAGFGTSFAGIGTLLADARSQWILAGSNTFASGTDVTVGAAADLNITGGVLGSAAFTVSGGTLRLPGSIDPASVFDMQGLPSGVLALSGMAGATGFAGVVVNMAAGDTIVLEGMNFAPGDSARYIAPMAGGSGKLVVDDALARPVFTFGALTLAAGQRDIFTLAGDAVTVACFVEGTRIATDKGEVPVEALRIGDQALTARGGIRPVIWIGQLRVDCARHPRPRDVTPIRVRAGAFGRHRPRRDLLLSPDHAIHIEGQLIPVRRLVDGQTIIMTTADRVSYWHVELDEHDILLAEGLPCESYLDTGNRAAFEDGLPRIVHPLFVTARRESHACAPMAFATSSA